jgi:hypothetical protein
MVSTLATKYRTEKDKIQMAFEDLLVQTIVLEFVFAIGCQTKQLMP